MLLNNFPWIMPAVYNIIKTEKDIVRSKELKESNRFKREIWYNRE
jgi:hypothetical protein